MKAHWEAHWGQHRKSIQTFAGKNAKRDAKRLVARWGGFIRRVTQGAV